MSARLKTATLFAWAALSALTAPACTSGVGLAAPRAMNHPVDVAFACFDTSVAGLPVVRPLSECALLVDVSTNTRTTPINSALHMHALVTQQTRGEVGAVDLIARGVLDSDQSVPGYTFVPVGELPTRIVVPPLDPTCTYVASRGPVDGRHPGISIIDTRRFRSGAGLDHNPFPLHAPYVLPSAPADMVLAPDGGSFFIALDAIGVVVRVPIVGPCQLGQIDLVVPLYEDVPAGVPYVAGQSADVTRQCGLPSGTVPVPPADVLPRNPDVMYSSAEPEPVAIEIDADNGLLLVADRGMPLVHRISIADGTLQSPIATGVPVREVVVTPRVPDTYALDVDPECADGRIPSAAVTFSRYLYAIDDTDGTVMAVEYTDPAAPGFGAVIPVDVRGAVRPDRIPMPVVARSLAIVTPSYDVTAADPRVFDRGPGCQQVLANPEGYGLCLPSDPVSSPVPAPSMLRGVFLVVAAADGSVRFIDVYDLDAPCRGRSIGSPTDAAMTDCSSPTVNGDVSVYIRRHRPRIQQLLQTFATITTGPGLHYPAGGSQTLDTNGRPVGATPDQSTPALLPVADATTGGCPAGMGQVWGGDAPIVCSLIDPFAAVAETWSATFEGVIPGTQTSSANAVQDASGAFTGEIRTRVDYCLRGVIGTSDAEDAATLPTDGAEVHYHGDMLALTGALPTGATDRQICRQVVGISNVGQTQLPILVRFDRAFSTPPDLSEPYTGRLTLSPTAPLAHREQGFLSDVPCDSSAACVDALHPNNFCDLDVGVCRTVPTIADAIGCYGDTLLTVEVRSYAAFTVTGTRNGFQTRVVRDDTDGHCRYDAALDPLHQGRAFSDVLYQNGRVAFEPTGVVAGDPATELLEIRIQLSTGFSQLGVDFSISTTGVRSMALPVMLRYSREMRALYAIETERRGLVEMTMRPFALTPTAYQ